MSNHNIVTILPGPLGPTFKPFTWWALLHMQDTQKTSPLDDPNFMILPCEMWGFYLIVRMQPPNK